ncbi:hypothetical protein [Desulforhopalus singaporensis]|uniref:Uncharacterized protein n=1 Tax=Desulforhopalus singaporensis TaxID=91360 RepID=A0A1H0VU47_9BACT|nr:hypothetical protein [Desulforhopalus singaporensis]SDP81695.1 hypothetical protein SAMN05660330_04225 [Desulforhopalus singaporensis]
MSTENTKTDYSVLIGKGILGAIPFVGPLIAETVGATIPNQRIDRINDFLLLLEQRIEETERENAKLKFQNEEFIDILEESMLQASRALSKERKEYIASIIANGIAEEKIEYNQKKLLLNILNELSDTEIIILQLYGLPPGEDREYFEKHKDILTPPPPSMRTREQSGINDRTLYDAQRNHLVRLNLTTPKYKKPKRGETPEFDPATGMMKSQGYKITSLGRLLLGNVGLKTW